MGLAIMPSSTVPPWMQGHGQALFHRRSVNHGSLPGTSRSSSPRMGSRPRTHRPFLPGCRSLSCPAFAFLARPMVTVTPCSCVPPAMYGHCHVWFCVSRSTQVTVTPCSCVPPAMYGHCHARFSLEPSIYGHGQARFTLEPSMKGSITRFRTRCLRFVAGSPPRTTQDSLPAGRYPYTGRNWFPRWAPI